MTYEDAITRLAGCRAAQPDELQVIVSADIVDALIAQPLHGRDGSSFSEVATDEAFEVLMVALAGNISCPCIPYGSRSMIDLPQIIADLAEDGWHLAHSGPQNARPLPPPSPALVAFRERQNELNTEAAARVQNDQRRP